MKKILILLYSIVAYLVFLAVFLYLIAFLGDFLRPFGSDGGPAPTLVRIQAIAVNLGLLTLFGVPHSVMARAGFKKWITGWLSPAAERSTYVLISSLLLAFVMWQWQPLDIPIWHVDGLWAIPFWLLFAAGWLILLLSTFLINHFELFGLQQGIFYLINRQAKTPRFVKPFLYKIVRHPMMLGMLLGLWATPRLTVGHLLFASGMTIYMIFGLQLEERDLTAAFGEPYRQYQRETPMLLPRPVRARKRTRLEQDYTD